MNCNDDEPIEKMQDNETGEQRLEKEKELGFQFEEFQHINIKKIDEKE